MNNSIFEMVTSGIKEGSFFPQIQSCVLPIFLQEFKGYTLFYAPGTLIATDAYQSEKMIIDLKKNNVQSIFAKQIRNKAEMAKRRFDLQHQIPPFNPYCLTLYTSSDCNLNCSYCYSGKRDYKNKVDLNLESIRKGAEIVAAACQKASIPMSVVFHGGGEPLIDPHLPEILACVEEIAINYALQISSYVATNGVISEETANWAADHIDQFGLSCDGYPDIQDQQRPGKNGEKSSLFVERTAAILNKKGKKFSIRATITEETYLQIPEIIKYCCGKLFAKEIYLEPIFSGLNQKTDNGFSVNDAANFCRQFLKGKELAIENGATVEFCGSRMNEIHGRYCQVFRHVLQLIPGGAISACFKTSGKNTAKFDERLIGRNQEGDWNWDHLFETGKKLSIDDPSCYQCFNRFHCARGCPDICPLTGGPDHGSFRCLMNKIMTGYSLLETADEFLLPMISDHQIVGMEI